MKRILVWVLILQFATGHNALAELLRVPALFEHYAAHQQATPSLSIAQFLWLHYIGTSHGHTDDSHAKLPLHCTQFVLSESVVPVPPEIILDQSAAVDVSTQPIFVQFFLPYDYSRGLLRPPIA